MCQLIDSRCYSTLASRKLSHHLTLYTACVFQPGHDAASALGRY
jgi:hypothetical protein